MEFFIYGNKVEVNDGQHGWAVAKFEGYIMYVNALVVSQDTPNYVDILAVGEAVTGYAKQVQRKISASEAYSALIEKFGGTKVICEELELKELEASAKELCIGFYNKLNGKYMGGYSVRGTFRGELESTLALKAHDNGIEVADIEVRYEMR